MIDIQYKVTSVLLPRSIEIFQISKRGLKLIHFHQNMSAIRRRHYKVKNLFLFEQVFHKNQQPFNTWVSFSIPVRDMGALSWMPGIVFDTREVSGVPVSHLFDRYRFRYLQGQWGRFCLSRAYPSRAGYRFRYPD